MAETELDLYHLDIEEDENDEAEGADDGSEPDTDTYAMGEPEVDDGFEAEPQDKDTDKDEVEQEVDVLADPEPDEKDDIEIALDDGTMLPVSELKSGYMRQSDYTRKTQEVAREREVAETNAKTFFQQQQIILQQRQQTEEFLMGLIPEEPDVSLIETDLARYHRAKATRDRALDEVREIIQKNNQVEQQLTESMQENLTKMREAEEKALKQKFPRLNRPDVHTKFMDSVKGTAEQLGFSETEFNSTFDHRILSVLYYASLGLRAKQAVKTGKPSKAAKNVGSNSMNTKLNIGNARGNRSNTAALGRLRKTGSIHDAMKVDIEI